MTAHPFPDTTPDDSGVPTGDTTVETPTPVSVWWVDDRDTAADTGDARDSDSDSDSDSDTDAARDATTFVSRLTRRLVLTYTRRGDAIVDLDGDSHMRAAASACGRDYIPVTDAGALADLDRHQNTSMITVRWPRGNDVASAASVRDLYTACGLIMNTGLSVLAVTATAPHTLHAMASRLDLLLPAAHSAGFRHALAIVALYCPGDGDRYLFYAGPDEAAATLARHRDTGRPAIVVDLFTPAANASRDV